MNASKRIKAFHIASKQAVNVLNATATYHDYRDTNSSFVWKFSTFFVVFVSFSLAILMYSMLMCNRSLAHTPLFVLSFASSFVRLLARLFAPFVRFHCFHCQLVSRTWYYTLYMVQGYFHVDGKLHFILLDVRCCIAVRIANVCTIWIIVYVFCAGCYQTRVDNDVLVWNSQFSRMVTMYTKC